MTTAEHGWGPPAGATPLVRGKDLGWYFYLYPARWLTERLPLRAAWALWDGLARLGAACLRRTRRRLVARLQLAYPARADRVLTERIAAEFLRNAIRRFGDDLLLPRFARCGGLGPVELVHPERLAAALARGRGALLVSGHFMASRVARQHLAAIGHPAAVVRNLAPRDSSAGRLGRRGIQRRYVDFLTSVIGEQIAIGDPDCSLKMMARLRAGGLVDVHVDAAFSRVIEHREFLGVRYPFAGGAFHLAWIVGAPVLPVHCTGSSRRLRIEFGVPIDPQDEPDRDAFVAGALDRAVAGLERQIRAAPAEWDLWCQW
jgi:lauroyl/myristoyl acyltransferase